MELRQLTIFCAAAETLNYTKAGENLGYGQSNITGQIQLLESELGVKLFERSGRGLKLTNEGALFYNDAKLILNMCYEAKNKFEPGKVQGILNIGAAESICIYYLPKILLKYRQLYPDVEIRIHTDTCYSFMASVKKNDHDIMMVLTDKIVSPEVRVEKLHDEKFCLFGNPLHPLAQKKKISFADLEGECLVVTLPGCGYRSKIFAMLKRHNVKLGSTMELSSVSSIKHCVIAGLGIALLPRIVVKNDINEGRLKEIQLDGLELDIKCYLTYYNKKWVTPAMQAFMDLCNYMENTGELRPTLPPRPRNFLAQSLAN